MLPIKTRHYNPLTHQFEDDVEKFNFYPTRYTPLVPETNQCDVEITRIKSDLASYIINKQSDKEIRLAKMNFNHNFKIAKENASVEKIKTLSQILINRTDKDVAGADEDDDQEGFLSFLFRGRKSTIVWTK